jgi:nucleotidyltransferase/DNA polymerase involved in DNA repair
VTEDWSSEPEGTAWDRAIIHVDLDAFYASVEQLQHPELRGKPVIVGGASDGEGGATIRRGVVSAASYEVRKFGVHSAMPLTQALRLCPQAIVVPVNFPAYREFSAKIFDILETVTPDIEPLSLDEGYLDVTHSILRFGNPARIAQSLRDQILSVTGLHASFGIATNKVVAKVASDYRKPRGFVLVAPGREAEFLAPMHLRALPGLGPATEAALNGLGITRLGELARLPHDVLERRVGNHASRSLLRRAAGIDESPVSVPTVPKSVSREETFPQDIGESSGLRNQVYALAADVGSRLRSDDIAGRTVTLKLRYSDFTTLTRQRALDHATNSDLEITTAALQLLQAAWDQRPVRLLGVGVTGIEPAAQLDLFDTRSDARVDRAIDALRAKFGSTSVQRGMSRELRDLDFRGDDLRKLGKR